MLLYTGTHVKIAISVNSNTINIMALQINGLSCE
ncbi:hypothetical protein MNBD_GAMMA25-114 [hydrothermal vent metagenome]|uniref:Uncharacterized protein n=1 Tax=hydrothermal vent metagenome TaxID=652676 RepID=A0A3B1BAN5_9ZZZZ